MRFRKNVPLYMALIAFSVNATNAGWLDSMQSNGLKENELQRGNISTIEQLYQNNGLFLTVLRELFTETDWATINRARKELVKVIRKINQLIVILGREPGSRLVDRMEPAGRWWTSGGKLQLTTADETSVKASLERLACSVGYMRLLNFGNEALAELDAAKVVTNLFNGSRKNSTWFG